MTFSHRRNRALLILGWAIVVGAVTFSVAESASPWVFLIPIVLATLTLLMSGRRSDHAVPREWREAGRGGRVVPPSPSEFTSDWAPVDAEISKNHPIQAIRCVRYLWGLNLDDARALVRRRTEALDENGKAP